MAELEKVRDYLIASSPKRISEELLSDRDVRRQLQKAQDIYRAAEKHSRRFREVSNRYPRRVAEAFDGDLIAALRASDDAVAERVTAWEREQGLELVDWHAVGASERMGHDRATDGEGSE
jgi:hypothetical protein